MKGFLIDTNVLSEYSRPGGPDLGVKAWLQNTPRDQQHISVITLAEIEKGIELLPVSRRRSELELWLKQDLETWFSGRIIPIDREVASRWALLVAQSLRAGKPMPTIDSLIAATALVHDLVIVTRNVRDFQTAGVPTINPWQSP